MSLVHNPLDCTLLSRTFEIGLQTTKQQAAQTNGLNKKKGEGKAALTTSRKQRVQMPESWLNEMSTTMFSIRHLISFTCTTRGKTSFVSVPQAGDICWQFSANNQVACLLSEANEMHARWSGPQHSIFYAKVLHWAPFSCQQATSCLGFSFLSPPPFLQPAA